MDSVRREADVASKNVVVISDSLHTLPSAVSALADSGHNVTYINELIPFPRIVTQGLADLEHADAIVMGRVMGTDAAALDLAPNLQVIAHHTSGTDNIDLEAASARGIAVTNVKGVNAEQCAEFSIGLMLAIARQIRRGDIAIRVDVGRLTRKAAWTFLARPSACWVWARLAARPHVAPPRSG